MNEQATLELLKLLEETEEELALIKEELEKWKGVAEMFASTFDSRVKTNQSSKHLQDAYGLYMELKSLNG